jgi:hypothetical protein
MRLTLYTWPQALTSEAKSLVHAAKSIASFLMKALFLYLGIALGQMNTASGKPIAHLLHNRDVIESQFGGKLLEVMNGPTTLYLPQVPPKADSQGVAWTVDVKNLGPVTIAVVGKDLFTTSVMVGQTVHITSNGSIYMLKH